MNQITERTERPSKPALTSGGSISAIVPQSIEEAYRIANAVVSAGMAPRSLDTPEKAMVAIMHGLEIGMTPMAAMQSIAVVNGFPTIWGDGALGLVRGSGMMEWIKEWAEGEGNGYAAHCSVKRKGEPEAITRSFSWDDAKAAGLLGKKGPWENYRARMFQMRARSYALRDGFADILRGLRIREEVDDYQHVGPDNARDITPAQPSVMQRLRAAQDAPQHLEEEREGFDAAFVHSETETALTGEILTDTNSDDTPSTASSSDTAGNTPADEAGTESPSDAPASTDPERDILIRFAAEMLPMAATAKTEVWKDVEKGWSEGEMKTLSEDGKAKAKSISQSIRAIAAGNTSLESAAGFHAEMLDCKASDLGGVDG
jgi:hypothetical protein